MKLNNLLIEAQITKEVGLSRIEMKKLSNVIAFVGKNGSGKTRILDCIEEHLNSNITVRDIIFNNVESHISKNSSAQIDLFLKDQEETEAYFEFLENRKKNATLPANGTKFEKNYTTLNHSYNILFKKLNELTKYVRRINVNALNKTTIPNSGAILLRFEDLVNNIEKSDTSNYASELDSIYISSIDYLKKMPHELVLKYKENANNDVEFQKTIVYKKFKSFRDIIFSLLGKDLDWKIKSENLEYDNNGVRATYSGYFLLNGFEFYFNKLSNGEKSLFLFGLMLFLTNENPDIELKDCIIIIDEPELHLHPDSEIDVIDALRRIVGETGQLILATHSLNILSHLNYEEVFVVDNGIISHPSKNSMSNSLKQLLSLDERISKLNNFVSSIDNWSYTNFVTECFNNPDVISGIQQNDPQILSFKKILKDLGKENSILLDFGAGKGRFFETLLADSTIIKDIEYNFFEIDPESSKSLVEKFSTTVISNYFDIEPKKYDIILLCNVLHEIPIKEWLINLQAIGQGLKTDGYLIIMEAKTLTKGEKIGRSGYLVLGSTEIKELFNLKDNPHNFSIDGYQDKIYSTILNKTDVLSVDAKSIYNSIIKLEETTFNSLKTLKDKFDIQRDSAFGFGRNSAFLSQQNLNARFASEELKKLKYI